MSRLVKTIITQGMKKKAVATCECTQTGQFSIRINMVPFEILPNSLMAAKLKEIICIVDQSNIKDLSFDITCKEGGNVSRVYAVRMAFAKAVLAFYGTYLEEWKKQEIQKRLMDFDRFSLVSDSRRREPKKFGGPGARARYQKSYR
ncbi:ribosomal protein S16 [Ordospora colligata]|nr:ribosomal protein S16 [Ordospora colligata]